MLLQSLTIFNYKNIAETVLEFSPKINCFIGNNGMGKTNLLDAIYYLSFCKSHFNSIDSQNIKHEAEFFSLQGKYLIGEKEEDIFCAMKRRAKKYFKRGKKEYERFADHIGLLPLVLISPDDSALISGGSDERRRFLDAAISQYDKHYLAQLLCYNNVLQQRNALLKNETLDETMLDVLEERMAEYGNYIYAKRADFIKQFIPVFQKFYTDIAGGNESISLQYISQHTTRDIRKSMTETRERDHILGFSTQGIHKDDLEMLLGEFPIKRIGSQGQNKTYAIALKLAQFSFLKATQGISPLLLLDDIFDKLDAQRVKHIVELVSGDTFGQIFITDTNREHLDGILAQTSTEIPKIFLVENGMIENTKTSN